MDAERREPIARSHSADFGSAARASPRSNWSHSRKNRPAGQEPEPNHRHLVHTRLPRVRIENLLAEVDSRCHFTQAFRPLEAHPPRAEPVYADSPPTAAIRDDSRAAHEPPVPGHPVAMKRKVALDWDRLSPPDGPLTVGIDGGFLRAPHKEGHFEVIAGKSMLSFRRHEDGDQGESGGKCFAFVQTFDQKPKLSVLE
jgi:hypothetical protein